MILTRFQYALTGKEGVEGFFAHARFSFLLSIPAVAASGLLELRQALRILPHDSLTTLAVGTIVSGIVGYATIWFLLRYLRTHTTGIFIGYRLLLGGAIP